MSFFVSHWPLWFISAAMIAAAVIDGWKLKVPNKLTFPLILSGWALGLLHNFGLFTDWTGSGVVWDSLAGTALGFLLLLPVYAVGGMGAGDVKMQMGFGAWVGAFYGLWTGLSVIFWAFCAAVLIGGVLAVIMMLVRGQLRQNLANARSIITDLFTPGRIGTAAEKAARRKPQLQLLPYGIPLCLGFLSYLAYHVWAYGA
jgi:prepilin peptidase CpaA